MGRWESPFMSFWKANTLPVLVFPLCSSSKLMEARCTSATCTLKTPGHIPASPRMRPAWMRTSLHCLWRTQHAKPVCINHEACLGFLSFPRGYGGVKLKLLTFIFICFHHFISCDATISPSRVLSSCLSF